MNPVHLPNVPTSVLPPFDRLCHADVDAEMPVEMARLFLSARVRGQEAAAAGRTLVGLGFIERGDEVGTGSD